MPPHARRGPVAANAGPRKIPPTTDEIGTSVPPCPVACSPSSCAASRCPVLIGDAVLVLVDDLLAVH